MGSPWVFDPDAWAAIKQYLGLGGSSSSGSASGLSPEAKSQKSFNLEKISDHVYEIHKVPISSSSKKPGMPSAKIFFFHGLQLQNSNQPHISTWLSRGETDPELWLNWLLEDIQDVRIFTISYDASPEKRKDRGRLDMYCTCENLVRELIKRNTTVDEEACPIVLVGHCLGGLVLKEICVKVAHMTGIEEEDERREYFSFLNNVKGIFCYSSPHHGSDLPDCNIECPRGALFKNVKTLDKVTTRRNEEFRKLRNARKWKSQGVGENHEVTLDHFKGLIVPEGSSRFDIDHFYTAEADHFDVCRPESRTSTTYIMIKELIEQVIKKSAESSSKSQGRSHDCQSMLDFKEDRRYVRLQDTEKQVREALAKPGEPQVVLLHGGTGRGKSTLAQDIALQVEVRKDQHSNSSSHVAEEESGVSDLSRAFDGVVYMKCGPEVQLLALQRYLLEKLGSDELEFGNERTVEAGSHVGLQELLKRLLQKRKVLLIFDDVWSKDLNVLQSMILLCGKKVKCLITSQDPHLCNPLNCSYGCIAMENVNREDARKILASHILGFNVKMKGRQIPEYVEGLADTLIERVDGNLLAVACLAMAFDSQSFEKEVVWNNVAAELSDYLKVERTAKVHGVGHDHGSYWAAMQISFQPLVEGAKKLLILVNLCRGSSVPEEVVKYFYKFLKDTEFELQSFSQAKRQLENRQLIKVERSLGESNGSQCISWSIHSLLKEFICEKRKKDENDVLCTLREVYKGDGGDIKITQTDSEVSIMRVTMGLYLNDSEFTEKVVRQMGIRADNLSTLHHRRYVIEALTRPLVSRTGNVNKPWDEESQRAARRVFLQYVQHGQIREFDATILLKSQMSLPFMVNVALKSSTMDTSVGRGVITTLLELLGIKWSQNEAVSALASLAITGDKEGAQKISNVPGAFQALVNALTTQSNPQLQANLARALQILATAGGNTVALEIFNTGGVVEQLADSLTKDDNPGLQKQAAWALGSLAYEGGHELTEKMCNTPGLVESLVYSLNKDDNIGLQEKAAFALANLTCKRGNQVVEKISNVPGAFRSLVNASTRHSSSLDLQIESVFVHLLVTGGTTVARKIFDRKEAMETLADSLTKDAIPHLQKLAALALGVLADEGGHELSEKMCNTPGLLEKLVTSLSKDGNPDLQEKAAWALGSLAYEGGRNVCDNILCIPGACEALMNVVVMAKEGANSQRKEWFECYAMRALSLIDFGRGQGLQLKSASAYLGRGWGELVLGLHKQALKDFDEAWRIQPLHCSDTFKVDILMLRVSAKASLGDLQGALEDSNSCVTFIRDSFNLQERGIVKRMIGDLPGALMDLDEGLQLGPDDYERLKHRGYVKFLLHDEIGAHADAKRALEVKPPRVDFATYACTCLGTSSVEYLGFKLQ